MLDFLKSGELWAALAFTYAAMTLFELVNQAPADQAARIQELANRA